MRKQNEKAAKATLALLVALASVSPSGLEAAIAQTTLAQASTSSESFPMPTEVPQGTTVRLSGSDSMAAIDRILRQRFQEQFPNGKVEIVEGGTDVGLQALEEGKVDLAAVGRPLTQEELDRGFIEVPVTRQKIAIVVGKDNPFSENLTIQQFAKIFRGEITDWSEVGGEAGPIRLVDRPETSDTRRSFPNYPVFKEAEFATGSNAEQLSEDRADAMVKALGKDGIGYALVSQVIDRDDVKIVSMHKTQPDDLRYPFSQPLAYVYKGTPSEGVKAFLGFSTAPDNQAAIEEAKKMSPAAVAAAAAAADQAGETVTPPPEKTGEAKTGETATPPPEKTGEAKTGETTTQNDESIAPISETPGGAATATEGDAKGSPWLWWLLPLIALLGGLGWLLNKGNRSGTVAGEIDRPDTTPPIGGGTIPSGEIDSVTPGPIAVEPPDATLPSGSIGAVTTPELDTNVSLPNASIDAAPTVPTGEIGVGEIGVGEVETAGNSGLDLGDAALAAAAGGAVLAGGAALAGRGDSADSADFPTVITPDANEDTSGNWEPSPSLPASLQAESPDWRGGVAESDAEIAESTPPRMAFLNTETTGELPTQSTGGIWQKASEMVQDAKESASNLVENATESGGSALAGGAAMATGAGAAAWSALSGNRTDEPTDEPTDTTAAGEIEPLTAESPTPASGSFWQKASEMVQDAKESASNLVENATESSGSALAGGAAMATGAGAAAWSALSGNAADEPTDTTITGDVEPVTSSEASTQTSGGFWQKASEMVQDAKESASNLVENATESSGSALAGGAAMAAGAGAAAWSALSPKRQPPDETLTEESHEATQAATFWVESASGTPIEPSGETASSDPDSSTDTKPSV